MVSVLLVLVGLVELDAAGHAQETPGRGQSVADRLRVLGTALHRIGDQRDLIIGMRMQVRRVLFVFRLERRDEILHLRTLIGRIELHDPDIAERRLAGLLLEAEWQPDGAELDRRPAAALGDAGLRERLSDLQSLAFERVGRNDVNLADACDSRRDAVKSLMSRPKPISAKILPPRRVKVSLNTLALPIPALVFS